MRLTNEQMLPRIRRKVPQVLDLLQAEEGYLEVVIDFIGFLNDRSILLSRETMTDANLKKQLKVITGLDADIITDTERPLLTIRYHCDPEKDLDYTLEKVVLKLIPAHLQVIFNYLKEHEEPPIHIYIGTAVKMTKRMYPENVETYDPLSLYGWYVDTDGTLLLDDRGFIILT